MAAYEHDWQILVDPFLVRCATATPRVPHYVRQGPPEIERRPTVQSRPYWIIITKYIGKVFGCKMPQYKPLEE